MSEILYSLMRIGFASHQIQFTSILGKSALSVSDCSEEPYWFLNHTKHLHCLCQANPVISSIINREVLPQEDVTQDPELCRWTQWALLKGGIAATSIILGESEIHTSQHEPLVTSPNIQAQQNSLFYFPLLLSITGFSQQRGIWEFINQRGPRHEVAMRKGVGEGRSGGWETEEWKTTKSYCRAQEIIFNIQG